MTVDSTMIDSRSFYDEFSTRLLAGYVYGNLRIERAIEHAVRWIPDDASTILDVGCGIGWSTWEMKKYSSRAMVTGYDLSPAMVAIAKRLFVSDDLTFSVFDITSCHEHLGSQYDVIVMLDVYEHIPRSLRSRVHQTLRRMLTQRGTLILSCPTVEHQQYLRDHHPEGLQPVDEDVTFSDVSALARDVGGQVCYYHYQSIWRPNDYVHITICRPSPALTSHRQVRGKNVIYDPPDLRSHRVSSKLGVRVAKNGFLMANQHGPNVCVVSPNDNAYSETFIRAHMERIPANVSALYGGAFPAYLDTGQRLLPAIGIVKRVIRKVMTVVLRLPSDDLRSTALMQYLRKNHIEAVLAEYGPTGVAIMDVCQEASIPLIVHFHGYDAFHQPTLELSGGRYADLFRIASAIVVVSREMERQLIRLGAPQHKIHYNPCGANTELFRPGDIVHTPPTFVAVGRFAGKKGPHLTLLAFQKAVAAFPTARLIMIGDGILLNVCQQMAKALKLDGSVEFLGVKSPHEIATILRTCRSFIQHSITTSQGDAEGTPVAVLEAGAAGLPVIATRHGGIGDVVIHRQTGLLVNEGDVDEMAEYIVLLAQDAQLAETLGAAARKHVCANYSLERSIEKLWQIIHGVIH
jgi:colanic acid/amylovoran biosynthesis glycosyltransferase